MNRRLLLSDPMLWRSKKFLSILILFCLLNSGCFLFSHESQEPLQTPLRTPSEPGIQPFPEGAGGENAENAATAPGSGPDGGKRDMTKPLDEFELGRFQYCGSDRDCIVVNNGCCDCANGGQDASINRERVQNFRSRFECDHARCTMKEAYPECGTGVVSCINHRCKYIGPEADK